MERKVAVLISWVNTFISYKEFDELFHGAHKDSALIHDKYHRNYEFIRLLNEMVSDPKIEKIVIYSHGKIALARDAAMAAEITASEKIEYAFFTDFSSRQFPGITKRIDSVISRLAQNGVKDFIVIDTMNSIQQLNDAMYRWPDIRFLPVVSSLFGRGWHYYQYCSSEYGSAYYYADSVAAIRNFIAYHINSPEKAVFIENGTPSEDCEIPRWFLFDYYPTSRDAQIHEDFSIALREDIKDETADNCFSLFFFRALDSHIHRYIKNINECAFIVLPSHTKDKWNEKLIRGIKKVFIEPYQLLDLTRCIRRTQTVPKQSVNGRRSMYDHVRSLTLQQTIPESIKYIFLLDDITTTGGSFQAAAQILHRGSYKGAVLPFAVAGTQSSGAGYCPVRHNIYTNVRTFCSRSYIFDLDGTLVDSDAAKEYRARGQWNEIAPLLPQMHPYSFLVEEVKQLIIKNADVAIVTSSPRKYAEMILRHLGIVPESVILICYHDTKLHKPSADPYLAALKRMRCRPDEIYCFGDKEEDIAACRNANAKMANPKFRSILVTFSNQSEVPAYHQDYTCRDELDCIALIRTLSVGFLSERELFRMMSLALKRLFFNEEALHAWIERMEMKTYIINGMQVCVAEDDSISLIRRRVEKYKKHEHAIYSLNAARVIFESGQTEGFKNFCSKELNALGRFPTDNDSQLPF